jgi:hypothetical protein
LRRYQELHDLLSDTAQGRKIVGRVRHGSSDQADRELEKTVADHVDFHDSGSRGLHDPIEASVRWGLDQLAEYAARPCRIEEFRFLKHLLRRIDQYQASRPLQLADYDDEKDSFFLGRRWWHHRSILNTPPGKRPVGPLDERFGRQPFPHLRRVPKLKTGEWVQHEATRELFREAARRRMLRVVMATLSERYAPEWRPTELISEDPSTFGYVADRVTDAAGCQDEYLADLERLAEQVIALKADVLCLPELMVCEAGRRRLWERLGNHPDAPSLVIPGSFYEYGDEDPSETGAGQGAQVPFNTARIWVKTAKGYDDVGMYDKWIPFGVPTQTAAAIPAGMRFSAVSSAAQALEEPCDRVEEHILTGSKIQLVPTRMGVFGVAICKDVLVEGPLERYRHLVDHLLIVAMNGGEAYFSDRARHTTREFAVGVFFTNAAVAVPRGIEQPLELAFWSTPWAVDRRRELVQFVWPAGSEASEGWDASVPTATEERVQGKGAVRPLPNGGLVCFQVSLPPGFGEEFW